MKTERKFTVFFLFATIFLLLCMSGCAPLIYGPPVTGPPYYLPITDNFSADCAWPRGETETFTYGCDQGAYRFRLKKPGPVNITNGLSGIYDAVSAEVDATVVSGIGTEPGKALLGIGCLCGGRRGYVAILGTKGKWGIVRYDDPKFTTLAGTNEPGQIHGLNRTNRLRIVCINKGVWTTISFFVNGNKIGSAEDNWFFGKKYRGFFLYTDTFPGEVAFEHFVAEIPAE